MPKPPVPEDVQALLRQANPAVIGTLMPDGSPNTVATWYVWDDGRVLVNMEDSRKRLAWMRADPRVALTVLKDGDWSKHVSLRGHVVEWADGEQGLADIDRIARHYGLDAYPVRDKPRVSAWIEVTGWHAWYV
jgi:PPOX class probable F420-dependent enzyme